MRPFLFYLSILTSCRFSHFPALDKRCFSYSGVVSGGSTVASAVLDLVNFPGGDWIGNDANTRVRKGQSRQECITSVSKRTQWHQNSGSTKPFQPSALTTSKHHHNCARLIRYLTTFRCGIYCSSPAPQASHVLIDSRWLGPKICSKQQLG